MKFEIVEHIVVLSEKNGWIKELNKVAWGDNKPKYDIRSWTETHESAGKGVTLNEDELEELKKTLAVM